MSQMYEIELQFTPGDNDPSDWASFEQFLDCVTDELDGMGVDADYTASAADLRASWTIEVPDASEGSLIGALNTLKKALVSAGCEDVAPVAGHGHEVLGARRLAMA
jgi:hypothetical protein